MKSSETGRMVAELKRFARNEIEPFVLAADDSRDAGWTGEVWKKTANLDLPTLTIPEKDGGAGGDDLEAAFVVNTFGMWCAGLASAFAFHYAACRAFSFAGKDIADSLKIFSAASCPGDPAIMTVILPDPSCGDFFRITRENGSLVISGSCPAVGNAALAKFFMAFAKDENNALNLVLLSRSAKGISLGPDPLFPGLCANPLLPVNLECVRLNGPGSADSAESFFCMVLESGSKAEIIQQITRNAFFGFIAAIAAGLTESAFNHAFRYAKSRYQFGKIIVHHSELQRMLGKMLQSASVGKAAFSGVFSDSAYSTSEAACDKGLFAKAWCADTALSAASDCVQIFGGYGLMHEYGMEKRMRDAKMLQLLGGPTPWLLVESVKARLNCEKEAN